MFAKQWFKLTVAVPIALTALGAVIINIYLSTYALSDFSVFQARALVVGGMFVVAILANVIILLMFEETLDFEKTRLTWFLIRLVAKIAVISNLFFSIFCRALDSEGHALFGFYIPSGTLHNYSSLSLTILFIALLLTKDYLQNSLPPIGMSVFRIFFGVMLAINFVIAGTLYAFIPAYRPLPYFSSILVSMILGYSMRCKDRAEEDPQKRRWSFFTARATFTGFDKAFSGLLLLVLILVVIAIYARGICPLIPQELGGLEPQHVRIQTIEEHDIDGEMLYFDGKRLLILIEAGTVQITDINQIRTITY